MTTTRQIEFPGGRGDLLAARLELPDGPPQSFALFAHCFTCTKDYKAVVRISRRLAQSGVAVCRFDFTGLGDSAGDFAETNFTSNLEDLLAAAKYMRDEYRAPQLLIGHSLGGAAILAVAGEIPEAAAVVTIAAPSDTEHLSSKLLQLAPELSMTDEAEVSIAGRSFRVRRQLLRDLASHRMSEYLAGLDRPLLIIHSPQDQTVGIENAERLFAMASHPKSLIAVDGADHLLARPSDWRFVATAIESWASRYVVSASEPVPTVEEQVDSGRVRVRIGESGFKTEIQAGRHSLEADEPVDVGGSDLGPDPYSYLLAALGACKAITMRMYAARKGWDFRGSQIELSHAKIHAKDCEDCETDEGWVDRIDVALEVLGDLDENQARRLIEISQRCPVHKTLKNEVTIRTTAV